MTRYWSQTPSPHKPSPLMGDESGSVPHLKSVTGLRLRRFDIDPLYACRGRALAQVIYELLDGVLVALEMRLDAAIGSVADPADDTERLRLLGGPRAEEDALD